MEKIRHTSGKYAFAKIKGTEEYPSINGKVFFKQLKGGVLVTAHIYDLPGNNEIFGFHIHEGRSCSGDDSDLLRDAKMHYNPKGVEHPYHAGDMPPLFGNRGYAYLSFYTNRFNLSEIIGRVVIIHDSADDFKTQPGGDSGRKIACGKIVRMSR